MRWFLRDGKFYVGPLSDVQLDDIMSKKVFTSCGIACRADSGKVETYLTVPETTSSIRNLEKLRFVGISS